MSVIQLETMLREKSNYVIKENKDLSQARTRWYIVLCHRMWSFKFVVNRMIYICCCLLKTLKIYKSFLRSVYTPPLLQAELASLPVSILHTKQLHNKFKFPGFIICLVQTKCYIRALSQMINVSLRASK